MIAPIGKDWLLKRGSRRQEYVLEKRDGSESHCLNYNPSTLGLVMTSQIRHLSLALVKQAEEAMLRDLGHKRCRQCNKFYGPSQSRGYGATLPGFCGRCVEKTIHMQAWQKGF